MISKIDGTGPIRGTQPLRRAGKAAPTGSTSFTKHLDETSDVESTGATQSTAAVGNVSGVVGLQEVDDALAHASKGKARAQDILDQLDGLRMELLNGSLTRERLLNLTRMVTSRRASVTDPTLKSILDDVDLRARVELAKYGPAGSDG